MAAASKRVSIMCFHDELCQDLFVMLHMEGAKLLACPLNIPLFSLTVNDLVEGVSIADPATYSTGVVLPADMNLSF